MPRLISRSSERDRLLALGAGCAALALLLLTAGQALILRDFLRVDDLRGSSGFRYDLGQAFQIFSALALSLAFGIAAWGLASDPASRSRRLGTAMVTAAIGFLAATVAVVLFSWIFVQYHYLHIAGTAALTSFLNQVALALAAAVAAFAFFRECVIGTGRTNPLALLRRACLILATGFALLAATDVLYGVYWGSSSPIPDLVAPSDLYIAGFWVAAGGNLILASGGVTAGVAFNRGTDRDQRLKPAATILALGFLAVAIGRTLSLVDDPNIEPSGTAGWLDAATVYGLAIAMLCGAAAFHRAGRDKTSPA